MVQSVFNVVASSNVTTNTQGMKKNLCNYKGRKISPVDNNAFFFSGISKKEFNDYVDRLLQRVF